MNATLPQTGETFECRYRIACRLGTGADGYVFGATELDSGDRVAIKCWVGRNAGRALTAKQDFVRAANAARLFDNPHIVAVSAAEAGHSVNYCVTEWLQGITLAERLSRRPGTSYDCIMGLRDLYVLLVPCIRAVARAHAAGIVHGDLRPGHIFVCDATAERPEIARVFDFGGTGIVLSDEACAYATPEYLTGAQPDARSDCYAFGVMMYEMITGQKPYVGRGDDELADKIMAGAPRLVAAVSPAIPSGLARVIERAMAVDPDARYASLTELLQALAPFAPAAASAVATSAGDRRSVRALLPLRRSTPPPPPPPRESVRRPSQLRPPSLNVAPRVMVGALAWEATEPYMAPRPQLFELLARASVTNLVLLGIVIGAAVTIAVGVRDGRRASVREERAPAAKIDTAAKQAESTKPRDARPRPSAESGRQLDVSAATAAPEASPDGKVDSNGLGRRRSARSPGLTNEPSAFDVKPRQAAVTAPARSAPMSGGSGASGTTRGGRARPSRPEAALRTAGSNRPRPGQRDVHPTHPEPAADTSTPSMADALERLDRMRLQ